jgi:CheY-like chemotaxis protein
VSHEHTILIVDGDAHNRESLSLLLRLDGFRVVAVPDAAGGLAALRTGDPVCFIILDDHLPEKEGFEFRAQQLLIPKWRNIPTALCTEDGAVRERALALGFVHVFTKPVARMKVVWLVEQHCAAAAA